MPYRVGWGPKDGSLIVVTETAVEALRVIRRHQAHPADTPVDIATLAGQTLSETELAQLAESEAT
jgi:phosphoglycolate phosphatase-like HAD superfamily hydrolase